VAKGAEGREEVGWAAARVAGNEVEGKAGGWEEGTVAVRGVEKGGEAWEVAKGD
jgi:hypothetical protein